MPPVPGWYSPGVPSRISTAWQPISRTIRSLVEADLAPPRAGTELAERILQAVDGVDILVNNAGIPMRRKPEDLTEENFDLVFSINVRSLLMLTLGLGPSMIERGGGSIINISSAASLRGPLGRVAYAGTKGAVDAMTRGPGRGDGIDNKSPVPSPCANARWHASCSPPSGAIKHFTGDLGDVPLRAVVDGEILDGGTA